MQSHDVSATRRTVYRRRRNHYRQVRTEALGHPPSPVPHGGHTYRHAFEHAPSAVIESDQAVARLKEQLMRSTAEFENFRKRQRREQQNKIELANMRMLEELLPVLDNFQRAFDQPGESVESLLSGIQMVHQQLLELLKKNGLEPIDANDQPFDPNLHEAVSVEPADGRPENHVVEVLQEGYQIKGRLLRPAMVKVTSS